MPRPRRASAANAVRQRAGSSARTLRCRRNVTHGDRLAAMPNSGRDPRPRQLRGPSARASGRTAQPSRTAIEHRSDRTVANAFSARSATALWFRTEARTRQRRGGTCGRPQRSRQPRNSEQLQRHRGPSRAASRVARIRKHPGDRGEGAEAGTHAYIRSVDQFASPAAGQPGSKLGVRWRAGRQRPPSAWSLRGAARASGRDRVRAADRVRPSVGSDRGLASSYTILVGAGIRAW